MLENLKELDKKHTTVFVNKDRSNYLLHQREGYESVKIKDLIAELEKPKNQIAELEKSKNQKTEK